MLSQTDNRYMKNGIQGSNINRGVKVYVGSLDPAWSEQDIHRFMSRFGRILKVTISRDESQKSRGYGFVNFFTSEEADRSIGTVQYQHKTIVVKPSHQYFQQGYFNKSQTNHIEQDGHADEPCQMSASPRSNARKTTVLSKYSKDFDTIKKVASLKSTDVDDISVKVIKITNSRSPRKKEKDTSDGSPINSSKCRLRPLEKTTSNISKFSKEYYPPQAQQLTNKPKTDFSVGIANPAAFKSGHHPQESHYHKTVSQQQTSYSDVADARFNLADSHPLYSVDSAVIIKFYTFPGRD